MNSRLIYGFLLLITSLETALAQTVSLDSGLVAYYPFNGNAKDESSNGNDGTVRFDAVLTTDRFGTANSAFSFDGSNDDIMIPDNGVLDLNATLSISLWFYVDSNFTTWQTLLSKGNHQNENYALFYRSSGDLYHYSLVDGIRRNYSIPSNSIGIQTWYHAVVRFNDSKAEIFLNGKMAAETDWEGGLTINDEPLYFGSVGGRFDFDGKVDDIRIYNRALSDGEINQLYVEGTIQLRKPEDLTSQVLGLDQIELSWTDTNQSEDGYEIWRSEGNDSNFKLITLTSAKDTRFIDTDLAENTTYFYRIKATSQLVDDSQFSEVIQSTTLPKVALDSGLIAYYPFNGNAMDESGNGNDGASFGAELTRDRFGNLNSAYFFDGIDDYITADPIHLERRQSLVAWIKPAQGYNADGQVIIENRDNRSITDYALFIDKGNNLVEPRYFLRKADGDDGPSIKSNKSFEEEQWLLLIGIYDGQSSSIYVNGQLQGESTLFTDALRQLGTSFRIGDDTGNNAPFKGIIDDVRVYNRALNEEEIISIYDNGGYQENDAALIDFGLDDGIHVPEGNHPIQVIIQNVGNSALTSATVNWKVNGMPQPPLDWTGSLDLLDTAYLTLGDLDFQSAIIYTIEASVSAANDSNSLNNVAVVKDLLVIPAEPHYALDFDGDEDYLTVSEELGDFNVQNLTVEAWVKPERLTNWSSAVIKSTRGWGDGFGLVHYTSNNDIRFFVNSYSNVNVRGFLELDKWQHVAGSYDGQFLRLFINGKQVDSLAYAKEIEHSETNLLIGNAPERNYHWEGAIDEVRIWNTARTPGQIRQFMVKNDKLKEQVGLVAAWHFGENIGDKTLDIASGKPAVFEGKPAWVQSEAPIGDNQSNNDAGILAINSPQNIGFEAGEKEVIVTLQNYGSLPLTKSTINWSVNEQLQRAFTWNGVLLPYQRDTVAIGRFNFSDGKPYALKAWTSGPNGLQDESRFNDSTEVLTVYAGLAGTYTIGGLNPDFETLTEAVDALNNGGISGEVIFNIRSGVYNEKVAIQAFKGTDCGRKVVFQSETGNREDVIIKSNSTADDNYIIQINGAKGIVIRNLTIHSEGNETSGKVIDLVDSVGCIEIRNNHLIGITSTSTDTRVSNAVIAMLDGQIPVGTITVTSNLIENGSIGIFFGNRSPQDVEYLINKNEFINQSWIGVETQNLDNVEINGNLISDRGIRSDYNGIFIDNCDQIVHITNNEVRVKNGDSGIQFNGSTPPSGSHSVIGNNFILLSSTGDGYGINLSRSNRVKVYHNTVHILENGTRGSAFRMWNGGSNSFDIDLKNNILINKGQGYSLRSSSWNETFTSDFNVLLSEGEFLATSFGGDFATLADWQTRYSSQDQNSISIDPLFLSDTAYVVTNPLLNNLGTVLSQVPTDIEGKPRNAINPDVGVVEFESPPNDVGIVTFVAPGSENCNLSDSVSVAVELLNFSGQPQSGFELNYRIGNGFPVVEPLPDSVVMLPGERYTYPFVQKANLSDLGQFRIKATVLVDGDENYANDTLSLRVENFLPVAAVDNLLPADSSSFNELPVVFSWSPAANATHYDLYIWRVSETKPTEPTVADIPSIRYTLRDQLEHGTAYYWQIVAKNVCSEEPSTIQMLVTRDLPDLVVDVIEVQGTPFSGKEVPVSWTIKNNGLGATGTTQWFDALYLSNDPALSDEIGLNANGRDIYLGAFPNSSALQPGESYKNSTTLNLPRNTVGDRYLLVISDFYRQIQETDSRNNLSFSEPPMDVQLTPPPDLQVSSVTVPTIPVFSSRTYPISWEVVNTGTNPTQTDSWKDRIYLTTSDELNPEGATILADIDHTGQLEAGGSYTANAEITLPQGIDGDYYIFVHTDIRNQVFEHTSNDNNVSRSDSLEIVLLPPPDLVVNEVLIPNEASGNQSIEVSWEVQNIGAGDTEADSWTDAIFISEDTILSTNSAVLLGVFSSTGRLKKDSLYTQTATVRLPNDLPGGAYFLHVLTDRENQIFEFDRESNNSAASPKTLSLGVPDLLVSDITPPPLLSSGNPITVNYTLQNDGPGRLLEADFIDRIYISPDPDINDPDALLLGRLTNNGITLFPDSIMHLTRTFMLPEGLEGSYYLGIHTDANARVFEDSRDFNNISYTASTVNISLSPSPDLQVQTLEYAPEKQAGDTLTVRYTIQNSGLGDVIGESWQDELYIADSTTWINGEASLLNQQVISQVLPTGDSYEREVTVTLPTELKTGTYYLYLETNINDAVYEHAGAKENNMQIGESITITAYPDIDLQVVRAEANVNSPRAGERLSVSYSVANRSEIDAVFAFQDALYLSADTVLEKNIDIRLQTSEARPSLSGKASYENSLWASLPNGVGGEFFYSS
jgi:hypothetical protein